MLSVANKYSKRGDFSPRAEVQGDGKKGEGRKMRIGEEIAKVEGFVYLDLERVQGSGNEEASLVED